MVNQNMKQLGHELRLEVFVPQKISCGTDFFPNLKKVVMPLTSSVPIVEENPSMLRLASLTSLLIYSIIKLLSIRPQMVIQKEFRRMRSLCRVVLQTIVSCCLK